MQKGVQKTEEMLVKVKQRFGRCPKQNSINFDHFDREAQSLVLEKWFRDRWGWGNLVKLYGPIPFFRLQPPADGRPFYLVKNSLSSLIKEVEGSRTVLKVKSSWNVQIDFVQ